jgi:hypothetical protein
MSSLGDFVSPFKASKSLIGAFRAAQEPSALESPPVVLPPEDPFASTSSVVAPPFAGFASGETSDRFTGGAVGGFGDPMADPVVGDTMTVPETASPVELSTKARLLGGSVLPGSAIRNRGAGAGGLLGRSGSGAGPTQANTVSFGGNDAPPTARMDTASSSTGRMTALAGLSFDTGISGGDGPPTARRLTGVTAPADRITASDRMTARAGWSTTTSADGLTAATADPSSKGALFGFGAKPERMKKADSPGASFFSGFGRSLRLEPTTAKEAAAEIKPAAISGKNFNGDGDVMLGQGDDGDVMMRGAESKLDPGMDPSNSSKATLVLIDLSLGHFCCGVVGSSGRFCILPRALCKTVKHRSPNPFVRRLLEEGVERALFIRASSSLKAKALLAFETPFLDVTTLDADKVAGLLGESRTVRDWTSLLPVLVETAVVEDPMLVGLDGSDFEGRAAAAGTPAKRMLLHPERAYSPLDLVLQVMPSGQKATPESVRIILTNNLAVLLDAVNAAQTDIAGVRNLGVEQADAHDKMVDRLNYLQSTVGQLPMDVKVPTIWQQLTDLSDDNSNLIKDFSVFSDALTAEIQRIRSEFAAHRQAIVELKNGTRSQVVTIATLQATEVRVMDALKALQNHTKAATEDADRKTRERIIDAFAGPVEEILFRAQDFFNVELPSLQARIHNSSMLNVTSGLSSANLSHGGGDLSSQASIIELRATIDSLVARQAIQDARLDEVEARTEDRIVVIDGEKFQSLQAVQAFCSTHRCAKHVFRFVCGISLMEMVTGMAQSYQSSIDEEHKGGRVGMEKPSDQKAHFALKLAGPTALIGIPQVARENPRKLNAFKNYDAFFGNGSSDTGAKNTLMSLLHDKNFSFQNEIKAADMSDTAKMLARSMLQQSTLFIQSSFTFMWQQMNEFAAQTSLSKDRRWELTQGIERILWHLTSVCLQPVSGIPISEAKSEERAPEILWAILQANRVQQEIMDHNFKNHPAVSPLLTRFLLDIVAFQDDVEKLKTEVDKSNKESSEAKRTADKAGQDARKALNSIPSKKQKKDEKD